MAHGPDVPDPGLKIAEHSERALSGLLGHLPATLDQIVWPGFSAEASVIFREVCFCLLFPVILSKQVEVTHSSPS